MVRIRKTQRAYVRQRQEMGSEDMNVECSEKKEMEFFSGLHF